MAISWYIRKISYRLLCLIRRSFLGFLDHWIWRWLIVYLRIGYSRVCCHGRPYLSSFLGIFCMIIRGTCLRSYRPVCFLWLSQRWSDKMCFWRQILEVIPCRPENLSLFHPLFHRSPFYWHWWVVQTYWKPNPYLKPARSSNRWPPHC